MFEASLSNCQKARVVVNAVLQVARLTLLFEVVFRDDLEVWGIDRCASFGVTQLDLCRCDITADRFNFLLGSIPFGHRMPETKQLLIVFGEFLAGSGTSF